MSTAEYFLSDIFDSDVDIATTEYTHDIVPGAYRVTIVSTGDGDEYTSGMTLES